MQMNHLAHLVSLSRIKMSLGKDRLEPEASQLVKSDMAELNG
jgi:hypothetical protein